MPFLSHNKSEDTEVPERRAAAGLALESTSWAREEYVPSSAARSLMRRSPASGTERQSCANPECLGGWKMPWRQRRRPVFEDRWGCSAKCLQAILRVALRRERGDLRIATEVAEPHQHRIPLGLVMLGQGWITQVQLRRALNAQREAGEGRIGEWLIRECGLNAVQVTRGLALQWSCPVLPVDGFSPSVMSLTMPRLLVEELGLLPLRVAGSRILYVAFKDRLDASAAFALAQMSGLEVVSGLLDEGQFDDARSRLLESNFVPFEQQTVVDADTMVERVTAILESSQPVGSRIVRVHQHYWLRTWLERGSYSGVGTLAATGEDVTDTLFTIGSRS